MNARDACIEYERWAAEVRRLTDAIGEGECPFQASPEAETHYRGCPSCFREAADEIIPSREPDDGPNRRSLNMIEIKVASCESCTRLVGFIRARKHARQRYGVAKRAVRLAGKRAIEEMGVVR